MKAGVGGNAEWQALGDVERLENFDRIGPRRAAKGTPAARAKKLSFCLPWPPSENVYRRYVNGRPLLSRDGRSYKATVAAIVRANGHDRHLAGRLKLRIQLRPPDRRKRDIDNSLKALLDAMQAGGVYADDSQIDFICVSREEHIEGGQVWVTVREYKK